MPEKVPVRVLLADADPLARSSLLEAFWKAGASATTAGDGVEALRIASSGEFDVVVADIGLARLGGVELARKLGRGRKPPAVVLTTTLRDPRIVRQISFGEAVPVLVKPFNVNRFAKLVMEVGRGRRSEK